MGLVIEANADEGWLVRYVEKTEGGPVYTVGEDGMPTGFETERVEAGIKIVLGLEHLPEGYDPDVNHWGDIKANCVYPEDMNNAERAWYEDGAPMCSGCGETPAFLDSGPCPLCEYRNMIRMHQREFDAHKAANGLTIEDREGFAAYFYKDRRVKVIPDPKVEGDFYVDYHEGGDYEGWGFMNDGWYIRSHWGECGGCAHCEPDGPYADCDDAEEAMETKWRSRGNG